MTDHPSRYRTSANTKRGRVNTRSMRQQIMFLGPSHWLSKSEEAGKPRELFASGISLAGRTCTDSALDDFDYQDGLVTAWCMRGVPRLFDAVVDDV